MTWFAFVLLNLVTARITRYLVLDTMIEVPRERLIEWLQDDPDVKRALPSRYLRRKLSELIGCVYCVSVWVGGFVNLGAWLVSRYSTVELVMPLPAVWWLALSMGALVVLEWTDGHKTITLKQPLSGDY